MSSYALLPVRATSLEKRHFAGCYAICTLLLVASLITGALNPLPIFKEQKTQDDLGTFLDLHNARCSVDLYGRTASISSCWHHYFKFSYVWTQFFALDATFHLKEKDRDKGLVEPVQMRVSWYGRSVLPRGESETCSGEENKCTQCIDKWAASGDRGIRKTNLANQCMPNDCNQCNLECYLCLRSVELGDSDDEKPHCELTKDGGDTDVKPLCTDTGEKSGGGSTTPWEVIGTANQSMTRTINCPMNSKDCDKAILFETSHVEYNEFYFQVLLDGDDRNHHEWMDSVSFSMRYRNADFSIYEIGFRYAFSILNLLVWMVFECSVCRRKEIARGLGVKMGGGGARKSRSGDAYADTERRRPSLVQKVRESRMPSSTLWLRLLQMGLLMFNNPLYIFEYVVSARRFFGIVGTIFQVCFLAILMAYLLAEFEQLANDRADTPNVCEFTCSSLFRNIMIILFVLSSIPAYSYIKMQQLSNPLYDFTEEGPAWTFAKVFAGCWFCLYFLGLIYYTLKNFSTNFCSTQGQCLRCLDCRLGHEPPRWRKSWTFALHAFAILVGISGLVFGLAFGLETRTVFEFLFFYALFNIYVHTVTFLYYPSSLDGDGVSMADMEQLADGESDDDDNQDRLDGGGASI